MADSSVILVVDDDEDSIVLLENALDMAGARSRRVVARNGREAIDYLSGLGPFADRKKFPWPTLILLDLKMPIMDGFEVLQWFRQAKARKELVIVVMTASNDECDRERAMTLGAAAYYVKPVSFGDLVNMAREIRERWLPEEESHPTKPSAEKSQRRRDHK